MRKLLAIFFSCIALAACDNNRIATTDNSVFYKPGNATGHWIALNYWAKWCAPCREEIPELNRFAKKHSDKIQIMGVNFDRLQGQALNDDIAALDIQFPVLLQDPQPILGFDRPSALPITVLIAPDGKIAEILLGPQTEETLLMKTVNRS